MGTRRVFTFGFGQAHEGCYHVVIGADDTDCRLKMNERFGNKWAMIYESEEAAGVYEYNLKEIK